MSDTPNNLAAYIWSSRIFCEEISTKSIRAHHFALYAAPPTECVLDATKTDVLAQADKLATMGLPEETEEKMLALARLSFFNTSKMTLKARRVGHRG